MATAERPTLSADHVLATLATLPAVCPIAELAEALELALEPLCDLLSDLEAAGALSTWEAPDGPLCVILSVLSTARLGIRLDGRSERWIPARCYPSDDELPSRLTETDASGPNGDGHVFNGFADHDAIDPLDGLIAAEDGERAVEDLEPLEDDDRPVAKDWVGQPTARDYQLPKPVLLLGVGLIGYCPAMCEARPCPACRGRTLPTIAFCLCCCRSGVDHLLPKVKPSEMPKPSSNQLEDDPSEPVESKRKGFVVKGNVEVPEKFARLLKGTANGAQRKARDGWQGEAGGYRMNQNRRK